MGERRWRERKCGRFTVRDPAGLLCSSPGQSCHTSTRRKLVAATAATEINGIWQETLLFFQSQVLPSKHRDLDENGCSRGPFQGDRTLPHPAQPGSGVRTSWSLSGSEMLARVFSFLFFFLSFYFFFNATKMLNRKPFRMPAMDSDPVPSSLSPVAAAPSRHFVIWGCWVQV